MVLYFIFIYQFEGVILKFSEIRYERPNLDEIKAQFTALTQRLTDAASYDGARAAFIEKDQLLRHVETAVTFVSIRHSIDTRDAFFDAEETFWNETIPELQVYLQQWTDALLQSKFRPEFEKEFGSIIFTKAEMELKTFSPEIIPELQQENDLTQAYEKLLASAQIPFRGETCTLSRLSPYKTDADDATRLEAWCAEGAWYKANQKELDEIYDKLVHLRDEMGKKLGYGGYIPMAYYRMQRIGYDKEDVEKFRKAVVKYLVPIADSIYREQAKRLGKAYPMNYADNALMFRSGNARPCVDADGILAHGRTFYDALSPETGAFFRMMLDNELLDVLSTDGKQAGGYCTTLADYDGEPFIFANFNGTRDDVETVTHEAGHAFAAWTNRHRVPSETIWPGVESCEGPSLSMAFLAWPWSEGFFGADTQKFYYSHLAGSVTFIPYGTLVDHFQHVVFEKPDMTPAERHAVRKELQQMYMPWVRLDGEIPFYADGEAWQRQHHIYSSPFYYIDYCLAQTVALEIWALAQEDRDNAWAHYMAYTKQGGSAPFPELLKNAGLDSPFDENTLRTVCERAKAWLDAFDTSKLV